MSGFAGAEDAVLATESESNLIQKLRPPDEMLMESMLLRRLAELGLRKNLQPSLFLAATACVTTVSLQGTLLEDVPIVFTPAFCSVLLTAWFTNALTAILSTLLAVVLINYWILQPAGHWSRDASSMSACLFFVLISMVFIGLARALNRRFELIQAELATCKSRLNQFSEQNDSLKTELEKAGEALREATQASRNFENQRCKEQHYVKAVERMLFESQANLEHTPVPLVWLEVEEDLWVVKHANPAFGRLCRVTADGSPALLQGYGDFVQVDGSGFDMRSHPIARVGRGGSISGEVMALRTKDSSVPILLWAARAKPTGHVTLAAIPLSVFYPAQ